MQICHLLALQLLRKHFFFVSSFLIDYLIEKHRACARIHTRIFFSAHSNARKMTRTLLDCRNQKLHTTRNGKRPNCAGRHHRFVWTAHFTAWYVNVKLALPSILPKFNLLFLQHTLTALMTLSLSICSKTLLSIVVCVSPSAVDIGPFLLNTLGFNSVTWLDSVKIILLIQIFPQ